MPSFALAPVPRSFHLLRGVLVLVVLVSGLTGVGLFVLPHSTHYSVHDGVFEADVRLGFMDMGRSAPVSAVQKVETVDPRGAWRTSGTGMHDLCHGQWTLPSGTDVWMATTCTAPALMVTVTGESRPWVVSPEDPAALTAALESGSAGDFAAQQGEAEPWYWTLFRYGLPLSILGILAILLRAGRGMSVAVEGRRLVVGTGWRTLALPLAGATVRRGLSDRGWPWVKAVQLGAVKLGRQRTKQGPMQMMVTDPACVVEVHPRGGVPLAVSVVDPAGFVAACVGAGAVEG